MISKTISTFDNVRVVEDIDKLRRLLFELEHPTEFDRYMDRVDRRVNLPETVAMVDDLLERVR